MNYLYSVIILAVCITMMTAFVSAQSDTQIPRWIKFVAILWSQDAIDDSEFVNAIQFLIDRRIIVVPASSNIQKSEYEMDSLNYSVAAKIQNAYDMGYAHGKNSILPDTAAKSSDSEVIHGIVTKNIDGNTIEISGERIRLPFVWVEDSGNKTADHAIYAKQLCPVGFGAHYDVDDKQPIDKYGRTIAMVWCDGNEKSLDQFMVESRLGWIKEYYCQKSEFKSLDWVNDCMSGSQ